MLERMDVRLSLVACGQLAILLAFVRHRAHLVVKGRIGIVVVFGDLDGSAFAQTCFGAGRLTSSPSRARSSLPRPGGVVGAFGELGISDVGWDSCGSGPNVRVTCVCGAGLNGAKLMSKKECLTKCCNGRALSSSVRGGLRRSPRELWIATTLPTAALAAACH
jgi:hypothetical protein